VIIVGAGGHAIELLDQLSSEQLSDCSFFDNVTTGLPSDIFGLPMITDESIVKRHLMIDNRFIVATGNPNTRKKLFDMFCLWNGKPQTIISSSAFVSCNETVIGAGCNVMAFAFISAKVYIGDGNLINTRSHLHHHVQLGSFCEIGPGAILLGGVQIGEQTQIGAGAILLPGIKIGSSCSIGAGAVVTKNVLNGQTVKGNPAK
jgi:sugar O-acyltransferase (sialic acid O-acetyltransferase NeuD family)